MKPYKIAVNFEWTSKCNARCVMCPQSLIEHPQLMTDDVFYKALSRINSDDVFRTVVAGYGEPTTHPKFMEYVSAIGEHPTRFDMVTNGQLLDVERLKHLNGKVELLILSFSSIDPNVYRQVHVNLNHEQVKENIILAQKHLTNTQFGISLTPLVECIDSLPETITWLKEQGVKLLTMSPTLYNRAGTMSEHKQSSKRLREIIEQYNLHSQELDFIPSITDIFKQIWKNKFNCIPRNSDLFITSSGHYLYCYNDISHKHVLSDINTMSIREVLEERENSTLISEICQQCNMLHRYKFRENINVIKNKLTRI
jgi:MoaA/NifB/PqqE/SkfB family radical SAM enzyme